MVAYTGDTGECHVHLREDDGEREFASVSSFAVPSSIHHRIIRGKGSMMMDPGVSRFCSSVSSRVACRRAC
eukprot:8058103-Pyramimonas_sp.AAC.1